MSNEMQQAMKKAQSSTQSTHLTGGGRGINPATSGDGGDGVPTATPSATTTPITSIELEKHGEKLGEYKLYDSQLELLDIAGTRVVKCLYQVNSKTGKKKQPSAYVRIPTKHLTEELIVERIENLVPYVLVFLQEQEDLAIKAEHSAGLLQLYTEKLGIDLLLEQLEAMQEGKRLNKDKIDSWFTSEIEPSLLDKFVTKLGIDDNVSNEVLLKLDLIIRAYRKKFTSLASGKTFINANDCASMITVINDCTDSKAESSSLIGARLLTRLKKMSSKEDNLLESL